MDNKLTPEAKIMEVVYTYPDGRKVVRYSAPEDTQQWIKLKGEVDYLRERDGESSPYSYREQVPLTSKEEHNPYSYLVVGYIAGSGATSKEEDNG